MPRLLAASAKSRGGHGLSGRPARSGGSQARAMSWHHCAALPVAGLPGRGASGRRSQTRCPLRSSQCRRQNRPVRRVVAQACATWGAVRPAASSKIIRARTASCWPVVRARTRLWSSWRAASERGTAGGLGPGMPALRVMKDVRLSYKSTGPCERDTLFSRAVLDPSDDKLLELLRHKLAVPGNEPADVSNERFTALRQQLEPQLKPVLRTNDFERFDLRRAFEIVANLARKF